MKCFPSDLCHMLGRQPVCVCVEYPCLCITSYDVIGMPTSHVYALHHNDVIGMPTSHVYALHHNDVIGIPTSHVYALHHNDVIGIPTSTICLTCFCTLSVSSCEASPATHSENVGRSVYDLMLTESRCRGSLANESSSRASSFMSWDWLMAA